MNEYQITERMGCIQCGVDVTPVRRYKGHDALDFIR
jgi:hypothetical protein